MINRELIRVKVVQLTYAYYQNGNHNMDQAEKELLFSLSKAYDLYNYMLWLIVAITREARRRMEIATQRAEREGTELPSQKFAYNKFAVQLEDNPSYLSYGGEGNTAVYSEGVFVGYRYYDRKKMKVLFPFGYGLSYTTFAYSNIKVRRIRSGPVPEDGNGTAADTFRDTDLLEVSVDVTNTGSRFGKEVIQLYVSPPESKVFRPVRELRGFEKTALEPGQTKTVTFLLDKRAFAYWNKDIHDWFVQTGTYGIEICRSSRETVLRKEIVVTGTVPDARVPLTPDTIYMDLTDWPEAMEAFSQKILDATTDLQDDGAGQSEAAKEAITDAMSNAMAKYLPLRGLVSFGNSLSYDEICEKLEKMKK